MLRFSPTPEHRRLVESLVGLGIPEDEICRLVLNPATRRPIDEKTLRKYFPVELATGHTRVNAQVGRFIFATITGQAGGVADERARATLAMFWAKCRMGWKETVVQEHREGGPIEQLSDAELERIARSGGRGRRDPAAPRRPSQPSRLVH